MKSVFIFTCVLFLTACNAYAPHGMQYGARSTGSQNQYVPVIISDNEETNSVPAVTLCTREPYASYSNTPGFCNSAPVILP